MDFGCCLPFGHNLYSVKLYQKREEARQRETKAIVCRRAKSYESFQLKNFFFTLPVLYPEVIVDAEQNKLKRILLRISQGLSFLLGGALIRDLRANLAVRRMFRRHRIGPDDLIIFPSADYYGTRALLKKFQKIPMSARPRMHLRFIGVLELARHSFRNSLLDLTTRLNQIPDRVTVSAEVPRYARYLDTILPGRSVIAEPFPVETKALPAAKADRSRKRQQFTLLLPGVNRADKGYFELFNLAKELFFRFPNVKIVIQDMKKWDRHFRKKYQRKLQRLVNVELLPPILSREEIMESYRRADLILLHYEPSVYFFRGSAIHYEAIANRIPVLARKGSGFVQEVESWSSGWTYETKPELFARLEEIMNYTPPGIEKKMDAAFSKFEQEVHEATLHYLS